MKRAVLLLLALFGCMGGAVTHGAKLHNRKLLSCMQVNQPRYKTTAGENLPLCSLQRLPGDTRWADAATSANIANTVLATAAPGITDDLDCSGSVNNRIQRCWGGDGTYSHTTFDSINCCTQAGGCTETECVGK